ncbi:MAG: tRNA lysidine(34) synthetase TilS [Pseudomonadota bacterium]
MKAEDASDIQGTLERAIATLDRLAPGGTLGLAVSGGSDSLALLHLAARWAAARGRAVAVATIDHGLRGAAAAEAAAVTRQARRLGLPHQVLAGDSRGRGNLQGRAREARYAALAGWAASAGLGAVATAHTEDDQAETVLMRLARGAGVDGLAGISETRHRAGPPPLKVIRPLLGQSRAALRVWLAGQGIGWIEDPTNADPAFDRTRARTALAALAPLGISAPALAATAGRMRASLGVLDDAVRRLAAGNVALGLAGEIEVACGALQAGEPETAMRLLARLASVLTGAGYPPRREALERAVAFARVAEGGPLPDAPFADGILLTAPRRLSSRLERPVIALCRELHACAGPLAITGSGTCSDGTSVPWDGRLGVISGIDGLTLGALGETRLTAIKAGGVLRLNGQDVFDAFMASPRAARLSAPAAIRADGTLEAVFLRDGWAAPEPLHPSPGVFFSAVGRRMDALLRGV